MHAFSVFVHILTGSAALIAAVVAIAVRKGGVLHSRAGLAFTLAMIVMAATGAGLAAANGEALNLIMGVLTLYLVVTAWATVQPCHAAIRRLEMAAFLAGLCAGGLLWALAATGQTDGYPPPIFMLFGSIALLAAAGDAFALWRRSPAGRARLVRHLWRMGFALTLASAAFFLGQQDEFPKAIQGHWSLFLPPLAALAMILWWVVKLSAATCRGRRPAS